MSYGADTSNLKTSGFSSLCWIVCSYQSFAKVQLELWNARELAVLSAPANIGGEIYANIEGEIYANIEGEISANI